MFDALSAQSAVEVHMVESMEALHEARSALLQTDHVAGMFVRAQLPHYAPEDTSHGEALDAVRYVAARFDELLVLRMP